MSEAFEVADREMPTKWSVLQAHQFFPNLLLRVPLTHCWRPEKNRSLAYYMHLWMRAEGKRNHGEKSRHLRLSQCRQQVTISLWVPVLYESVRKLCDLDRLLR